MANSQSDDFDLLSWLVAVGSCLIAVFLIDAVVLGSQPRVRHFMIKVDDRPAHGLVAVPDGTPTTLVLAGHGNGWTASAWHDHLQRIAATTGALAVAMDYPKEFAGLARGAAETTAAARHFKTVYPIAATYLLGVSMGGAVTGTALAESRGDYDYWIALEPVTMLAETWTEAFAAQPIVPNAVWAEIERETGGTPADRPFEYQRRSPALRGADIAASGVKGAILVHAVNDGRVPYNQGREMSGALLAHGVPQDFYTVLRGSCAETGSSLTGHLTTALKLVDPACFAGHASEVSATHVVMKTGFDALFRLMSGQRVPVQLYEEFPVDQPSN